MSWVRYDDGFDSNPKVTAVIAEDPAALALHVLANTWSARQKRPGFVPTHQPAILVASKPKARKWTALLEKAGLWDVVEGGWEFHDHADYRMPPSSRQTAGTPEELSSKRREAGRKGGATTQRRKQTPEQNHEPPEQNQTWSSKSLSPVVASNEATPEPVPEILLPADAEPRKKPRPPDPIWDGLTLACGIDTVGITASGRASLNAAVAQLRDAGADAREIPARARRYLEMFPGATLTPHALAKHWAQCNGSRAPNQRPASTSDQRVMAGLDLADHYRGREPHGQAADSRALGTGSGV